MQVSVRKRSWRTRGGEIKEAWIVDYADQHGDRHIKTFQLKRDADAYHARVCVDVTAGVHTADSKSVMVIDTGRLWIESGEASKLERTTLEGYRMLLDLHIVPFIGAVKLAQLTVPMVRAFEDQLRADRSPAMVRKALVALSSILSDAQERGLVAQNAVRSLRRRRGGKEHQADKRQQGRLKIGVDIPALDEVRAITPHLESRWRPLFLTAIFTGLRASELRGLRWADVDFQRGNWTWYSPTGTAEWQVCSTSSRRAGPRFRSRPRLPTSTGRRSIRGCTRCATSMRRGASIAA